MSEEDDIFHMKAESSPPQIIAIMEVNGAVMIMEVDMGVVFQPMSALRVESMDIGPGIVQTPKPGTE